MIDHGQPVMGIFHRPRAEAELISEQDFDPRAASFQFVNIANADMGPWMPGMGLKRRLVSTRFILTELEPERSHGDSFRDQNCGFSDQSLLGSDQLLLGSDQLLFGSD